jgi:hypothetical protein
MRKLTIHAQVAAFSVLGTLAALAGAAATW